MSNWTDPTYGEWPILSTGNRWENTDFDSVPVWDQIATITEAQVALTSTDSGTDEALALYRELYTSSQRLTIIGSGFDSTPENNEITFKVTDLTDDISFPSEKYLDAPIQLLWNYSNMFQNTGWDFITYNDAYEVKASVVDSSCLYLIVTFDRVAPLNQGNLFIDVRNVDTNLNASGRIATLVARPATIVENTNVISSDTAFITLKGQGFDPNTFHDFTASDELAYQNKMTFNAGGDVTPSAMVNWTQTGGDTFVGASLTVLIVTFDTLAAQHAGSLSAIVDVSDQGRLYSNIEYTIVGTVVPAAPVITSANVSYRWDASALTIDGFGFDSSGWAYMEVALAQVDNYTTGSGHILLTETVMSEYESLATFTRNKIIIQVENMYALSVGNLYAAVRVCENVSDTNYTSSYCDTCTPVKCNSSWLYSEGDVSTDTISNHVWYVLGTLR